MGANHSSRPLPGSQPPVVLSKLSDEPRRVGCASFLRSDTLGSRHSLPQDDAWRLPAKVEPPVDLARFSLTEEQRKAIEPANNRPSKKGLVRVKAGLKTVLAHRKQIRPCSVAPDTSERNVSKSLSSLSTVDEATDVAPRENCARPHSVAGERHASSSFSYQRVDSVGSLQYGVRHADSLTSRCSSAVSCSSLGSTGSSSRAASRSSYSGSCSSLARTTRTRAATSSTSSQTDSGVFSVASSRRSCSSGSVSRSISRCSADRISNSPSPLCRSSRCPSVGELLAAFTRAVHHLCPFARREEIESWVKSVDRALIHSGWQEQPFLCAANVALVFAVFQRACLTEQVCTTSELRGVILTCLYVAYSYGGHEISYPLKPFLYTNDRALFWERCMRIACSSSDVMLRVNQEAHCYQEIVAELLDYIYN